MKLRLLSYLLLVAVAASLLTLVWLATDWRVPKKAGMPQPLNRVAQVVQASGRRQGLAAPAAHRVIAAPPVEIPAPPTPAAERYRVRNEFPEDRSQPLPLYLVDIVTGQEVRLGDDSGSALYEQARNDRYLLWWFGCQPNCSTWRDGFHAYVFATGADILIYPYGLANVRPKLAGDWVAYPGIYKGPKQDHLLLTNLVTQETITITTELYQPLLGNNEHLGISERLVAWISSPSIESITQITPAHLEIYDLTARTSITSMVIAESLAPTMTEYSFFSLAANETVVTWGRNYGYDVVTGSFFTFTLSTRPWTAWGGEVVYISPVAEQDRVLSWYIQTKGGSKY